MNELTDYFCPHYIKSILELGDLQHLLYGLTKNQIHFCFETILRSNFVTSKSGVTKLVETIMLASEYKQHKISYYVQLLSLFVSSHDNRYIFQTIPKLILKASFNPIVNDWQEAQTNAFRFKFLYECAKTGLIHISSIIERIKKYMSQYPSHQLNMICAFCWLAPEISEEDKVLYIKLYEMLCEEVVEMTCPSFFGSFYNQISQLRVDNWQKYRKLRQNGYFPQDIASAIRRDDLEALQSYFVLTQNVNSFVKFSIFDPSPFLLDTPSLFQLAAFSCSIKCFKFMLLNGANIDAKDNKGWNLAHFGVAGGSVEIIRLIEQLGCSFDGTLQIASLFHRFEVLIWLSSGKLNNLTAVHPLFGSILHSAAASFDIRGFLYLFSQGIDPSLKDSHGKTPLHTAVEKNRIGSIKLLLNHSEIQPNIPDLDGETPVILSTKKSNIFTIRALISFSNINVNFRNMKHGGETSLHILAGHDHFGTLTEFLKHPKIDLNIKNDEGKTPLNIATERIDKRTMQLLLAKKRNIISEDTCSGNSEKISEKKEKKNSCSIFSTEFIFNPLIKVRVAILEALALKDVRINGSTLDHFFSQL